MLADAAKGMVEGLREHRGWFLVLGIVLILLGVVALIYDFTATMISVLVFGWVLLIGGVVEVFHSFRIKGWGGTLLHLLSGLLAVIAGVIFIRNPLVGALTLTLVLGALFLVEGIFRIFGMARFGVSGWGVLGGIITALLGVLLLVQWPVSGLWFIGFAVGVDLIFRGWAWVMLSVGLRKIGPQTTPARAT